MKDAIIDKFVKEFEAKALKDEAQTEFWYAQYFKMLDIRDCMEGLIKKQSANNTHLEVGKKVRQAIKEIEGVMPENLLSVENIKQIAKK